MRHKDERRIIMEIVRLCVAGTGLTPHEATRGYNILSTYLIKGAARERKRDGPSIFALEQSLSTGTTERDMYPLPRFTHV